MRNKHETPSVYSLVGLGIILSVGGFIGTISLMLFFSAFKKGCWPAGELFAQNITATDRLKPDPSLIDFVGHITCSEYLIPIAFLCILALFLWRIDKNHATAQSYSKLDSYEN